MIKKFFSSLIKKAFLLLFFAIAVIIIVIGFHFNTISKKHYIVSKTISTVGNQVYQFFNISNQYDFEDDFQVKSTIKTNLTSEEFEEKSYSDPEYYKKSSFIKNLTDMNTDVTLIQSKKDNKLLGSIHEKIGEEVILNGKYYVENATKYYIINGIFDNYVNGGNSTYFETLKKDQTTKDNMDYLYNYFLNSLENSIYEEELNRDAAEITINNEKLQVEQISLRITDNYLKEIQKRVLKSLKKDERARLIITSFYEYFDKVKINEENKILKDKESYILNIYVRKLWYTPIKFEVIHTKDDTKEVYTFEGNQNTGLFYYSKNNELKYTANIESSPKLTEVLVYDEKKETKGFIKVEKATSSTAFNMNLQLDPKSYEISYTCIYKNYQKNNSYTKEDNLSLKLLNEGKTTLSGSINIISDISKSFRFTESIENSILKSTISDDQNNRLNNLYQDVKARLERR